MIKPKYNIGDEVWVPNPKLEKVKVVSVRTKVEYIVQDKDGKKDTWDEFSVYSTEESK